MKHTLVQINEMKNQNFNTNNIDTNNFNTNNFNTNNLSTNNINYIIDNFIIICNYNSNLHILSYQYLSNYDTLYIYTLIFISLSSGILELINFNAHLSIYITLFVGINNLILGIIFNRYKELKLASTSQRHYQYYNCFEKLKLKINMNNDIKNSNAFLYKNMYSFIKETNDEISMLFTTRPNFPSNILNEYQINKPDIGINNRNNIMYNRNKSMLFSINKSFNFKDMAPINEDDKEEYDNFMKSIKEKNIQKIKDRNQKLIHFK